MLIEQLKADVARLQEDDSGGVARALVRGLVSQGFQAILVYRIFHWFHRKGIPSHPVRFFLERFVEITTGISIPAACQIGKGLRIHHFGGIILHSNVVLGDNCTIYQGVTIGDKGGWGTPPRIGSNVLIGAGAKVVGEISIGDNVIIGANSVVTTSIPANTVVAGIPGKVIGPNKRGGQECRRQK